MSIFYKSTGLVLVVLFLSLTIEKREKDFASLLTMTGCCALAVMAMTYMRPVLDLLWKINAAARLQDGVLGILLKATGIGLVTEISGTICTDSGNGALAKVLRILASVLIFNLMIPLMESLLSFIQEMLYNI